jgi:hypothetical protein
LFTYVTQDLGNHEPDDQLSPEQGLEEVGDIWRNLREDMSATAAYPGRFIPLTWR